LLSIEKVVNSELKLTVTPFFSPWAAATEALKLSNAVFAASMASRAAVTLPYKIFAWEVSAGVGK
jgi:hypothetical protein